MNKKNIIPILKITIAGIIIVFLVRSNKIDFTTLRIYMSNPELLIFLAFNYFFSFNILVSLRLYLLLNAANLKLGYIKCLKINMIGLFFNLIMPGAVGGDVIKGVYINKENPKNKSTIIFILLLDRILGLLSLFTIGTIATILYIDNFVYSSKLKLLLFTLVGGTILAYIFILIFFKLQSKQIYFFENKYLRLLNPIINAFKLFRDHKLVIYKTIAIGCLLQFLSVIFVWLVFKEFNNSSIDLAQIASMFPIAFLITAIPISPAGFGIGHLAFENIFNLVGVSSGANVFNIVLIGNLAMNLIGVIPYLTYGKSSKINNKPIETEVK